MRVGGVKGVKSFRVVRLNADDSDDFDDSGRVTSEREREAERCFHVWNVKRFDKSKCFREQH